MIDPTKRVNLLPPGSTKREQAIQEADAAIEDLDAGVIRQIGGPDIAAVPAAYLPHRAWERSVDVWDPGWPDDVKRRVIAAAPEVHRYKGTERAVRVAAEALYATTQITEWWQTVPKGIPYTFKVTAFVSARFGPGRPVLTASLQNALYASVRATKPLSRAFELEIGIGQRATLGVAAVGTGIIADRRPAEAGPVTSFARSLGLAGVATALIVDRRAAEAGPATRQYASVGLAAIATSILVIHCAAEAA